MDSPRVLLLDTNIVSPICLPKTADHNALIGWYRELLGRRNPPIRIFLPEIVDYEVRRGLLYLARRTDVGKSVSRLDAFKDEIDYLPLTTPMMHDAALLWADTRSRGLQTAHEHALDGDVILAAQARSVNGLVVTDDRHLSRYVTTSRWRDLALPPSPHGNGQPSRR